MAFLISFCLFLMLISSVLTKSSASMDKMDGPRQVHGASPPDDIELDEETSTSDTLNVLKVSSQKKQMSGDEKQMPTKQGNQSRSQSSAQGNSAADEITQQKSPTTGKAQPPVATGGKLSDCVQECLKPITRLDKSLSTVYRNYDQVCDKLEQGAYCAQKCGPNDQAIFLQYTTFYRMHCVEFEEELEEHLPCLREASYKADYECRQQCMNKADKSLTKDEKQHNLCKNVECSMLCYYKHLSAPCPNVAGVLIMLNARNADEMRRQVNDVEFAKLGAQCRRIHDGNYVRELLMNAEIDVE